MNYLYYFKKQLYVFLLLIVMHSIAYLLTGHSIKNLYGIRDIQELSVTSLIIYCALFLFFGSFVRLLTQNKNIF